MPDPLALARAEAVPRRVTCGGIHLMLFMGNLLLRDNDQIVGAFARIKPSKGPCCGGNFSRTGSTVFRFLQKECSTCVLECVDPLVGSLGGLFVKCSRLMSLCSARRREITLLKTD